MIEGDEGYECWNTIQSQIEDEQKVKQSMGNLQKSLEKSSIRLSLAYMSGYEAIYLEVQFKDLMQKKVINPDFFWKEMLLAWAEINFVEPQS